MLFPDYILLLILETLCFADLCRARAVCKDWHRLIASHEALCCESWLHVKTDDREEVWCPRTDRRFLLELRDEEGKALQPISSSHGLVLCRVRGTELVELVVGNPWTKKWKVLPSLPFPLPNDKISLRGSWRRFQLRVDASNGKYKVTLIPYNYWLPQNMMTSKCWDVPYVFQFTSDSGVWSKHEGLAVYKYSKRVSCKVDPEDLDIVKGEANKDWMIPISRIAFDSEKLSWSRAGVRMDMQPLLEENYGVETKFSKMWNWIVMNVITPCTGYSISHKLKMENVYWHEYQVWVYNSTRLIGAALVTISGFLYGFAVVECKGEAWDFVAFATFQDVYGKRSLPPTASFIMDLQGDFVFWSHFRDYQYDYSGYISPDRKLPPAAYDLAHSAWTRMSVDKSPIYSKAMTFGLLSP